MENGKNMRLETHLTRLEPVVEPVVDALLLVKVLVDDYVDVLLLEKKNDM